MCDLRRLTLKRVWIEIGKKWRSKIVKGLSISRVKFSTLNNVGFLRTSQYWTSHAEKSLVSSYQFYTNRSISRVFQSWRHHVERWTNLLWRASQMIQESRFVERKTANIHRKKVMTVWVLKNIVLFYWTSCRSISIDLAWLQWLFIGNVFKKTKSPDPPDTSCRYESFNWNSFIQLFHSPHW